MTQPKRDTRSKLDAAEQDYYNRLVAEPERGLEDLTPEERETIAQERARLKLARLAAEAALQELKNPEHARAWVRGQLPVPTAPDPNPANMNLDGLYAAASEIAKRQNQKLEWLRKALLAGDNDNALRFAKELCGIEVRE